MDKNKILLVEDESGMARQMKWGLSDTYDVSIARDAPNALDILEHITPSVVLLDLGLPPCPDSAEEGLSLLEKITRKDDYTKVIVTTGNTERTNAMEAISLGAYDYYEKPVNIDELKIIISRAIYLARLEEDLNKARSQDRGSTDFDGMIGSDPCITDLFTMARKVAKTDFPVLIQGKSGTGKDRLAHAIHMLSERAQHPFVIVDCGAIPDNLLESELFGHERGAFTGAHKKHIGKIEKARKGTLVLDEIGELPLGLQVKLLRFLQEGTVERIGGSTKIRIDARVIAVTNVDLLKAVNNNTFREDLFYRLNVIPLHCPALKDHAQDIPVLAKYFLQTYSHEIGQRFKGYSPQAIDAMNEYPWPGNIREMQNRVRRAVVMAEKTYITPKDLELDHGKPREKTLKETRYSAECSAISHCLRKHNYNITRAAQALDVSRPTLHDLIKKHGISTQRDHG
ncbi:MAG: PEP-CTERM-box response regulator transcription factor [Thermodesulfobacteriota bacterium]|nr:PEP-CTERM-box response regulator transcription factor [Thermodesulfobacteriota bacterium]